MYRQFAFEGTIHEDLACVPLAVRRKLDLAAFKISLKDWLALSRSERLALCHLPVDTTDELTAYREIFLGFAARVHAELKPLVDPDAATRSWNAAQPPASVQIRFQSLGSSLSDKSWCALDEESRYALLKLSDPKHDLEKLRAAAQELGLIT